MELTILNKNSIDKGWSNRMFISVILLLHFLLLLYWASPMRMAKANRADASIAKTAIR